LRGTQEEKRKRGPPQNEKDKGVTPGTKKKNLKYKGEQLGTFRGKRQRNKTRKKKEK